MDTTTSVRSRRGRRGTLGGKGGRVTKQPTPTGEPTDAEVLDRVRGGDHDAFGVLVDRYGARITRMVRGFTRNEEDVRDIVQDAFLKAFARLDRFHGNSSFYTWLYRIAANTSMDHRKKVTRRQPPLPLDTTAGGDDDEGVRIRPEHPGPSPVKGAMDAELGRRIDAAIEDLPRKYREVILLREIEGLAYAEIARVLKVSRGTVESRLFRARERLRRRLGGPDAASGTHEERP